MKASWALAGAIVGAVVFACGRGPSPLPACELDASLTADECETVHGLAFSAQLPGSVGNAKADDQEAARLGFVIFYSRLFSSTLEVRCATCHLPESRFGDAKPVSVGLEPVTRNSPTLLNAARMTVFFWDGRADSLWSQPLFAFENKKEMNFTRLEIAHRVNATYKAQYETVFGPLPPLNDAARFPAAGKPGDAASDGMAADDRAAIDRVAANVGKALEAYMRHLVAGASPFDRFLGGEAAALSTAQRHGMVVALRAGCFDCHSGPMMTDQAFHNLGVPDQVGTDPDRGRFDGVSVLRANPFNARGNFVDGPSNVAPPADPAPADLGAFRTPTLRNLSVSAPYGHNGSFATLTDVVAFHLRGGGGDHGGFVGNVDPKLTHHDLPGEDVRDLVDFLTSLTGDYPSPPWNNWPQR